MKIKIRLSTIIFVIIIIAIIVSNFLPDKVKSTSIFGGKKYNSSANLEILNVYVSTTGNDSNNGLSEASAKKTIASAIEVAKQHIDTKNVVINLGSGDYYISEPININNENTSDQNGGTLTLTSDNNNAIINGGTVITNTWSQSASNSNIWTVQLDKSKFADVTGLYVDGEMKQIASKLVNGTPTVNANSNSTDIESAYLSVPKTELSYEDVSDDIQNMFIEHYWEWKKSTYKISSIESETNNLKLNYTTDTLKAIKSNTAINKIQYPPKYNQQTSKHYITNALCALDGEGEYYYNKRTGMLYYYSAQNPNNKECVIPSTEKLLTIQGTENKLASNIEIKNVTFKYGMSSMDHKVYSDGQAECGILGENNAYYSVQKQAQINLKYASNVKFDGCDFININTACIAVNDYCYNIDISNNKFKGIGGSAVRIGTINELSQNTQKDKRPLPTDFENVYSVSSNTNYMPCKINVENNQMTNISQNYISSPAVITYFANTVDIKQNSFNNCTYSAVSAGWGWVNSENAYITKSSGKINIEANRMEHIMTKAFDGAPIYTLGIFGDGITITKNYINTNESENGYHGGIYLDEGTENAIVTYNVVADCTHWIDARALMSAEATPTVKTIRNTTITNNYSNTTPPDKAYDKWANGGRISAHLVEGANTIYENNSVGQTTWNSEATEIINNSGAKFNELIEINPESIALNKTTSNLDLNGTKTEQLTATIAPTNANINREITWTSSNTEVADVSVTGLVTAKKKGTATITARTENGKTATCEVTVIESAIEINPESIALNKTTSNLDLNGTKTEQLTATIAPTNANINREITWTSSNTEVADVSATGLVTAKKKGTATITARTGNGKTATCEVTVIESVIEINPESITLNKTTSNLDLNGTKTEQLSATIAPTNANINTGITWTSSNKDIADISSTGLVTAKAKGKATITARTGNGKTATCEVTVIESVIEINPESITLNKTTSNLDLNGTKTEQLSATIAPTNANINTGITWTSSNTDIADVSSTGLVTAKAKGTATITARTENGKTSTCEVTVINTKEESPKPDDGNDDKTNGNKTPSDNTGTNTSDKNQSGSSGTSSSNKGSSSSLNSTDGSLATNKLPNTGRKGILYIITVIVVIFVIMSYTRWKKYKEIK